MAEQTIEDGAGRNNDTASQDEDTPQTAPATTERDTDVEESGAGYGNHADAQQGAITDGDAITNDR